MVHIVLVTLLEDLFLRDGAPPSVSSESFIDAR